MPVAPWDKNYDLWGLGPELAVIHGQPSRRACMVVSLPLVRRHIMRMVADHPPEWFLKVDSTGHIVCISDIPSECIIGWREYMGDGGWMTAEFRANMGLARLSLED
eukprot:12303288-Alexandrium_andersonii.AAC.1